MHSGKHCTTNRDLRACCVRVTGEMLLVHTNMKLFDMDDHFFIKI